MRVDVRLQKIEIGRGRAGVIVARAERHPRMSGHFVSLVMTSRKMPGFVTTETQVKILAKVAVDAGSRDEAAAFVAFEHHVDHIVVFAVLDGLSYRMGRNRT